MTAGRQGSSTGVWTLVRTAMPSAFIRNLVVGLVVATAMSLGAFAALDRLLTDARFHLATRPATGRIVAVEIDSASLNEIGVWPWPRALHAQLVDRLIELGARRIVFDIDFSADTTPENDRALADALARASGKVWLAAFAQSGGANGRSIVNAPGPALTAHAGLVSIEVPVAPDGAVRDYRLATEIGGWPMLTAGALLADLDAPALRGVGLDFGVDLSQIVSLSAADVLAGRAPRLLVEGHDVIVGASAQELRDLFLTPRYGVLPGLYLHTLAAETLLQNRAMRTASPWLVAALILGLGALAGALDPRLRGPSGVVAALAAALGVEAGAYGLHVYAAILAPTAGAHVAIGAYAVTGLVSALRWRRKLHAQAARERDITRAMLTQVVADNFDGVVVIDGEGRIIGASRPARELLRRDLEGQAVAVLPSALAAPVAAALDPSHAGRASVASSGAARLVARDGSPRDLEYVVTLSHVPEAPDRRVACLTFRDVTERRAHEARLDYLARHDELTGAWSRGQLVERMRERLKANDDGLTVYCLDLRRFDLINDVFGHRVGDALLIAVASRLRLLGFDMVARLGGPTFAFAALGAPDPDQLEALGSELVARLTRPYPTDERPIIIGGALGATTSALSGADPTAMLTHASMAQAYATRRIGDVCAVFSPDMEALRREKQTIDADLRNAIADGALGLQYQPKVDLKTGRFVGAEALMRWRAPNGKPMSPAKFVPVAEESGLIVELGRWVLRRACAAAAGWPEGSVVAVNVSPVQFGLIDVFAEVKAALEAAGLAPQRLEVEITESVFVEGDSAISTALDKLRAFGVKIALDDFGTGYSSLHYLGRLPIDTIKIDQSFTRAMRLEQSAAATVSAIVSLAKAHGKTLVAEGIEDADVGTLLAAMGCEYGQGYYYGKPQDPDVFLANIRGSFARAA